MKEFITRMFKNALSISFFVLISLIIGASNQQVIEIAPTSIEENMHLDNII